MSVGGYFPEGPAHVVHLGEMPRVARRTGWSVPIWRPHPGGMVIAAGPHGGCSSVRQVVDVQGD